MPMPAFKVGTSGYAYFWNEGVPTPFDWYVDQGFDTVEINSTFYRFPNTNMVRRWGRCPDYFDFSFKIHRSITHYHRLRGKALELFVRFSRALEPMKDRISFWLFQMPPEFDPRSENIEALAEFFGEVGLGGSAVIEFRHKGWWDLIDLIRELGICFCSVDAPDLPRRIVSVNGTVYLRLHGREEWYSYIYTREELEWIAKEVSRMDADRRYIYLNNDTGMLPNALYLLRLADSYST